MNVRLSPLKTIKIFLIFFCAFYSYTAYSRIERPSAEYHVIQECYRNSKAQEDYRIFCNGSLADIKNAIEIKKYSPNQELRNFDKQMMLNPLLIAAGLDKPDIFFYLLSVGADPQKLGDYKISPLHLATEIGNLEMIKELIKRNLNMYTPDNYSGLPPFIRFLYPSDNRVLEVETKRKILKVFIDAGANINWPINGWSMLLLVTADLDDSHSDLVQDILDYGANIDAKNIWEGTALSEAIRSEKFKMFKLLLARKANPNIEIASENILCSLVSATDKDLDQREFKDLLDLIFNSKYNQYTKGCYRVNEFSNRTPLMQLAATQSFPFAIPLLISKGIDINAAPVGLTAFHLMCDLPYPYSVTYIMAQALIDNGLDIKSNSEKNPLLYCIDEGFPNPTLISMLIDNGSYLEGTNRNGFTPLLKVLFQYKNYDPSIAIKMIQKSANVNARAFPGTHNYFPLQLASEFSTEIVSELIKYGAELNMQDSHGTTALMQAVQSDQKNIVVILLKAGASPDLVDTHSKKALDYAKDDEMRALFQH